jgi:hypothetical protein
MMFLFKESSLQLLYIRAAGTWEYSGLCVLLLQQYELMLPSLWPFYLWALPKQGMLSIWHK